MLWYVLSNDSEEMVDSFFRVLEQAGREFLLKDVTYTQNCRAHDLERDNKPVGKLSVQQGLELASGCVRVR